MKVTTVRKFFVVTVIVMLLSFGGMLLSIALTRDDDGMSRSPIAGAFVVVFAVSLVVTMWGRAQLRKKVELTGPEVVAHLVGHGWREVSGPEWNRAIIEGFTIPNFGGFHVSATTHPRYFQDGTLRLGTEPQYAPMEMGIWRWIDGVCVGQFGGYDALAFRNFFEVRDGPRQKGSKLAPTPLGMTEFPQTSVVALKLPVALPYFHLMPERKLQKVLLAGRMKDLVTESAEFNAQWMIQVLDEGGDYHRYVSAVLNPRVMDLLMKARAEGVKTGHIVFVNGHVASLEYAVHHSIANIDARLALLRDVTDAIAPFVVEEYGRPASS